MKPRKKIYSTHKATGAKIPVVIRSIDPPQYSEDFSDRKAYTIEMLTMRWDKSKKECSNLLQKYLVPAYLHHSRMEDKGNLDLSNAIDNALFFEEYINAIEKKENLKHIKLKARDIKEFLS